MKTRQVARALVLIFLAGTFNGLAAESAPTFAGEVAGIVYANCVSCHHDGGIGPFPFIEYKDVARRSRQIAEVVQDGYMPPWKPTLGHGPDLKGERRLSEAEIATLLRWHEEGALPGDLSQVPEPPYLSGGWELGQPDLILELPEPYQLKAEGLDVFRNFIIPIPIGEKRYVRAFEFLPATKLAVHHASFALSTGSAERLRDEEDPEPGYDSMDLGDSINPNGHIIGWTPGQVPYKVYPGTAWELNPGVDLLMQLHLLPTGKIEAVRPRIGLYFSDEPPTRVSYVALLREYDIDIPAGAASYEVEERFQVPVEVQALGLFPHAHYLGKDFRIFVELPDGERRWLLRIDNWDFNWQSDYTFREPLDIPAGSELVMQLSYDNSPGNFRNPSNPPRRVGAGWGSFDEMGEVAIQLLLKDPTDLAKLEEAAARYELKRPETAVQGWYNVALALSSQGRESEAIEAYEECLYLDPNYAKALNNLGAIYEDRGRAKLSLGFYEKAVAADAGQQDAYLNMARAYARGNRVANSIETLRKLLLVNELHLAGRRMIGLMYLKNGDFGLAVSALEKGMQWYGADPVYCLDLVDAYALAGRQESALALARRVVDLDPGNGSNILLLAVLAYQLGDASLARSSLQYILSLEEGLRPSMDSMVASLPFPQGIVDLAEILAESGNREVALSLLDQAIGFARSELMHTEAAHLELTKNALEQ